MSEFGKAFAAARKKGLKTFTFKGKRYHTKTKDDMKKATRKAASKAKPKRSPLKNSKGKARKMQGPVRAPKSTGPKSRPKNSSDRRHPRRKLTKRSRK